MNLVLVEHADGVATDVSLQALALAAGLGGEVARAADRAWRCRSSRRRAGGGCSRRRAPALDAFAPDAWAAIICALADRIGATAVVAPGTGPATDAMARAAVRVGEPLAANVTAVTAGHAALADAPALGREPARGGRAACRTCSADGRAAHGCCGRGRRTGLGRDLHAGAGRCRPRRARARPRRSAGGRCLARRREGRRHRRPRRWVGGRLRGDRGARGAARRCRRLLARRDDVRLAPAHRSGRADGEQDRAGDLHRLRRVRGDAAHRGLPRARSGSWQ